MGRRCHLLETRQWDPEVMKGFDSHVSPNGLEYIVFDSAQILPIYVLHLGNSSSESENPFTSINLNPPGPVYFKGNLTEYARKHLPMGFGASTGYRFVVEAIAPVDDDEELWGEYQVDDYKGEFQLERKPYHQ